MNQPNTKKNWQIATVALAVIVLGITFYFLTANLTLILDFCKKVNLVLRPIYAGAILAFLLLPIHKFFYAHLQAKLTLKNPKTQENLSNGLAIFLSLSLAIWVVFLLLAMVLPELYLSVEGLFTSIPSDFTISTPEWLQHFFTEHPDVYSKIGPTYEQIVDGANQLIQTELLPKLDSMSNLDDFMAFAQAFVLPHLSGVLSSVSNIVGAIIGFIFDTLVSVIVSVYLLARKTTFAAQAKKLTYAVLPTAWGNFVLDEVRNAYRIMSGFINGKLLDSVIIGIICFIGSTLLKLPYASLVATVIGVTNVIPFFGPFIGAVPCGVLIFLVSPIKCLYFVGFIIALQQFDGNILGPKILGESTGLASFWVLFSIILFGGIFGFAGMVLGVPIFATFYSMMSRWVRHMLKKRHLPEETSAYAGHLVKFEPTNKQN